MPNNSNTPKNPPKKSASKLNIENKRGKIRNDLIREMIHGYRESHSKLLKEKLDDETTSLWMSLNSLKNFIKEFEMKTKKEKIDPEELGVQIYFAKYPDLSTWDKYGEDLKMLKDNETAREFANKQTVLFIPTINNEEGFPMDFEPEDKETYKKGLKKKFSLTPHQIEAFKYADDMPANEDDSNTALNHASLIPPSGTA